MLVPEKMTMDPSTIDISQQLQHTETKQENSSLSFMNDFLVNTKMKGNKINMKQYQQKLELKNKYVMKLKNKQRSISFRGENNLFETLGWDLDEIWQNQGDKEGEAFTQRKLTASQKNRNN